ncbi:MAG: hypothetical protein ACPG5T_06540 [Endozoicomonas sp.]
MKSAKQFIVILSALFLFQPGYGMYKTGMDPHKKFLEKPGIILNNDHGIKWSENDQFDYPAVARSLMESDQGLAENIIQRARENGFIDDKDSEPDEVFLATFSYQPDSNDSGKRNKELLVNLKKLAQAIQFLVTWNMSALVNVPQSELEDAASAIAIILTPGNQSDIPDNFTRRETLQGGVLLPNRPVQQHDPLYERRFELPSGNIQNYDYQWDDITEFAGTINRDNPHQLAKFLIALTFTFYGRNIMLFVVDGDDLISITLRYTRDSDMPERSQTLLIQFARVNDINEVNRNPQLPDYQALIIALRDRQEHADIRLLHRNQTTYPLSHRPSVSTSPCQNEGQTIPCKDQQRLSKKILNLKEKRKKRNQQITDQFKEAKKSLQNRGIDPKSLAWHRKTPGHQANHLWRQEEVDIEAVGSLLVWFFGLGYTIASRQWPDFFGPINQKFIELWQSTIRRLFPEEQPME